MNNKDPMIVTLAVTRNISPTPSISKLLAITLLDPHMKAAANKQITVVKIDGFSSFLFSLFTILLA